MEHNICIEINNNICTQINENICTQINENICTQINENICTQINENICYICLEPNAKKTLCKCSDRYIHDECLIKSIKYSHKKKCLVCLEDYPHINIQHIIKYHFNNSFYIFIFYNLFNTIGIVLSLYVIIYSLSINYINNLHWYFYTANLFIVIHILCFFTFNYKQYIYHKNGIYMIQPIIHDTIVNIQK